MQFKKHLYYITSLRFFQRLLRKQGRELDGDMFLWHNFLYETADKRSFKVKEISYVKLAETKK